MHSKKAITKMWVILLIFVIAIIAAGAYAYTYLMTPNEYLVVAIWGGPTGEAMRKVVADEFENRYGVEVVYDYHGGGSSIAVAKLRAQWPKPKIDVACIDGLYTLQAASEGFLFPLTTDDVPNLDKVATVFLQKHNGEVYGVGFQQFSLSLAVRTDLYEENITSYSQLWDPKFKGKIAVADINSYPGLFLTQTAIAFGGDEYNPEPGFEAIKELAEMGNIAAVAYAAGDYMRILSAPEAWISFSTGGYCFTLVQDGIPVEFLKKLDDTKVMLNCNYASVVKDTGKEDLAKKFIELAIELNEEYSLERGYAPTVKGAEMDPALIPYNLTPEEAEEYGYSVDLLHLQENIKEWTDRWRNEIVPLIAG